MSPCAPIKQAFCHRLAFYDDAPRVKRDCNASAPQRRTLIIGPRGERSPGTWLFADIPRSARGIMQACVLLFQRIRTGTIGALHAMEDQRRTQCRRIVGSWQLQNQRPDYVASLACGSSNTGVQVGTAGPGAATSAPAQVQTYHPGDIVQINQQTIVLNDRADQRQSIAGQFHD